ncbi:toxin-antitoxin system protein [filamentous cyanobacterium CCP2]|nr:toxin-antitoxin system protein [filamentous cyanobacterium CCP2]
MVTKKARVTIYLPERLRDTLTKLAEQDKRSLSIYVEILLLDALERKGITLEKEDE